MNQTSVPLQHNNSFLKKFLHTKLGAFVGYKLGVSGFNRVDTVHTRNGKVIGKSHSYNARPNVGASLIGYLISGVNFLSLSSPGIPKYIALSTSSLTPAAGDTTLSGETAVSGLTRAAGTAGTYTGPASLDAGASYILTNTFTAGGSATIVSSALFDASSSGNLFVEANLNASSSLISGDLFQVSWTINY